METQTKKLKKKIYWNTCPWRNRRNDSHGQPIQGSIRYLLTPGASPTQSWFKNIKGTHRVVFDAAEPNDAFGIIWTWGFYATNNATGSPDNDITAVCVFRHNAMPFALEDGLWNKYKLGETFNIKDNRTKGSCAA